MEVKLLFILIFSIYFNLAFSQREIIDIQLDRNKSTIEIYSDSSFFIEKKTIIKVDYKGDGALVKVKNSEGNIRRIGKGLYEVSFPQNTTSKATVLKLYEKTPKNEIILLLTKAYRLERIPPPLITIGGVKNDSSINIEHLIRDNYVRSFDTVDKQLLMTHSFTINFSGQDSIRIKGNKIPISVKQKLYSIEEGGKLSLSNIYTILPDQRIYVTNSASVFLIQTDQYSVGKRRFIKP